MPQILEAGLATVSLIPDFPCPLAGFYARTGFSQGAQDPLEFTALYLRQGNNEVWIGSADLCQFPDHSGKADGLRHLRERLSCPASALFLNASHTHGSPTVNPHPVVLPPPLHVWFEPRFAEASHAYTAFLWSRVAEACESARENAAPCSLLTAEGVTRLPMNRRKNVNGFVENAPCPEGEIDNRIRLLGIRNGAGELRAMGIVLSCHPTSTGAQDKMTADFPGAWRREMRKRLGDGISFFFLQGSGGDSRPACTSNGDHWRTIDFAELEQMGRDLADETEETLRKGWKKCAAPALASARGSFALPCIPLSPAPLWVKDCAPGLDAYREAYLDGIAEDRRQGIEPPLSIPLDLSLVRLAPDLALIGADFEVLCGLGRRMESALPGVDAIVCGLTNGAFGYVPDDAENLRGGYEAESYIFEKWGGPFAAGIDRTISAAVQSLWADLPSAG